MFLNQVHYLWRDLGRASSLRTAVLVVGPLAVFAALALLLRGAG